MSQGGLKNPPIYPILALLRQITPMRYRVHVPSAPYESETVDDLDRAWHVCLDLSEEFGYAEVRYSHCSSQILGSYTNGQSS